MIKQIQLRGISRTPSDRMSEDGGLSESLNMYMDTAENAPAIVPKDSTKDLGLPEDLKAERIFIHKTANYENYIVVQEDRVVAYTPKVEDDEPLTVLDLAEGEGIHDIASVGNTLVVSTTKNMYYILYKDNKYTFLGNKIPFFYINFEKEDVDALSIEYVNGWASGRENRDIDTLWFMKGLTDDSNNTYAYSNRRDIGTLPSESEWTKENFSAEKDYGKDSDAYWFRHFKDIIDSKRDELIAKAYEQGCFSGPIFIRYELETYQGKISSMPILIKSDLLTVDLLSDTHVSSSGVPYTIIQIYNYATFKTDIFKVLAKMEPVDDYAQWADIIQNVNIYVSLPIYEYLNKYMTLNYKEQTESVEGVSALYESKGLATYGNGSEDMEESLLLQSSFTYKILSFPFSDKNGNISKEMGELIDGKTISLDATITDSSILMTKDRLKEDDMKHYITTSPNLTSFNNMLLLTQPSQIIDYDYNALNAIETIKRDIPPYENGTFTQTFDVTYIISGVNKEKAIKKQFVLIDNGPKAEYVYAFQIFPDNRANKMLVKCTSKYLNGTEDIRYGEFEMTPHPYLDCAYYYGGIENNLVNLCDKDTIPYYDIDAVDDLEDRLFCSRMNDPFSFPIEQRFSFQSKVVGIAVATTALSQGQFGQYPLYVFTEDGIWAMETAADGSFVSQKPLSREVCCNPASITAIDNAVVFVTDKAVMLIQGAQVMNISPYMNGKHYIPNDSARNIIAKQDGFAIFDSAISDTTPFMAFMKKASIAYDYTGQRLICFASDEIFQYVYKLDTQTWHKTMFSEINLDTPLNSYPECLVLGSRNKEHQHIYNLSTVLDTTEIQQTAKGILITRPFDLGMPDVYKSITNIKIRGDYEKGSVRHILQGSDNGRDFFTLTSLRGKSWKMFRIFILADLEPTERISWIDIDFEPRYNNRLR